MSASSLRHEQLHVGSLFSGIGGFDLGFERAGMRTDWFVERDEYCRAVLAKHWPGVPCHEDVREVGTHNLGSVDVLCGGFPCQDLSTAGKGAGLDGARSGLWSEFARIIGELRPRYVVVENVPVLRSRGLGRILGEMAALGYDAEWDCVPAAAVGAPHRRDRIWIVGYPNGDDGRARRTGEPISEESLAHAQRPRLEGLRAVSGEPEVAEPWFGGSSVADADEFGQLQSHHASSAFARQGTWEGAGRGGQRGRGRSWSSPWAVEPDVGRVAHGVPARVDRLRALGNALVPQIAEAIGRRILAWEGLA